MFAVFITWFFQADNRIQFWKISVREYCEEVIKCKDAVYFSRLQSAIVSTREPLNKRLRCQELNECFSSRSPYEVSLSLADDTGMW